MVSWCLVIMFCRCCFVCRSRIPWMAIWYPSAVGEGVLGGTNSKLCPSRPMKLLRSSFRTEIASSRFKTIPNIVLTSSHKKIRKGCISVDGKVTGLSYVKIKRNKKNFSYCLPIGFLRNASSDLGSSCKILGI
jgi:hypothetical protein